MEPELAVVDLPVYCALRARAGALPDLDALERLDRLREQAARLSQYQREDNPSGTGWLLYARNGSGTDEPVAFARVGKHFDHLGAEDFTVI